MTPDLRAKLQSTLGTAITLERELGGGGMSRVFEAEDNSLGRKIVVKILPSDTAAGVSVERFKREIQVVARLQHPHIVPVLSAGEIRSSDAADGGLPFYTMPFVKGESLRARLSRGGELSVSETVHLLRDVASALAYAHGEGVVHRDIKPDNIIVSGGVAVVTDFGVAKAVDIAATSGDRPHTGITSLGVALGTPAYMSPEQASADPQIDHRADIYAFGVLGYELLAGMSPFAGRAPSQILAAQVTEKPEPIQKRRPNIPPALGALVMRCLEKHAGDRPQSADELLTSLDAIATTPSGGMPPTSERLAAAVRSGSTRWIALAAVLLAVAALGVQLLNRAKAGDTLAIGTTTPVANTPELEGEPAISPDGKVIAYRARTPDGDRIFLKQIDGGRSTMLTGDTPGFHFWPRWSPDGSRLSFVTRGAIYVVPALTGGSPKLTIERGLTHSWSRDGTQIAYEGEGGIWIQTLGAGAPRKIASGDLLHSPVLSPDGRTVAFVQGRRPTLNNLSANRIWTTPVSGGPRIAVSDSTHVNASPAWMPDGRSLLFISGMGGTRDVYQQRVNAKGEPSGAPTRVTSSLSSFTMTLSADGSRIAYDVVRNQSAIWMTRIASGRSRVGDARPVTQENETIESFALSHDGQWLAYDSNRGGNFDIYKLRLDGRGDPIQVTTNPANDFAPSWSPDDRQIAFHTPRNGTRDIYVVSAEGTGETQVTSGPREDYSPSWSATGAIAFFDQPVARGAVWTTHRDSLGHWADRRVTPDNLVGYGAKWSPDGKLLAYSRPNELGVSLPDGTGWRVLADAKSLAGMPLSTGWSADGKTVFVSVNHAVAPADVSPDDPSVGFVPRGYSIMAVPLAGGKPRTILAEEGEVRFGRWEFATDGQRLFFTRAFWESDVWVMDFKRQGQ